jgi:flavodoxin
MTRVYYFTRTGDSRKIAQSIAAQTGGTVFPIEDGQDWSGVGGFLRGGRYAAGKKTLPAVYEKPQEGDAVYLCFPIWAGSFPPAVRTFVGEVGRGRIVAVFTSMSSHLKDSEGFAKVVEVIGKDKTVRL